MRSITRVGVRSNRSDKLTEVIVTPAICKPRSPVSGAYGFSSGVMRYGAYAVGVGSTVGAGMQPLTSMMMKKKRMERNAVFIMSAIDNITVSCYEKNSPKEVLGEFWVDYFFRLSSPCRSCPAAVRMGPAYWSLDIKSPVPNP